MTDNTRTELRQGIEKLVRMAALRQAMVDSQLWSHLSQVVDDRSYVRCRVEVAIRYETGTELPSAPELASKKQLALSVLLDENVPLGVLLSACEDDGTFPNGVLEAVAEKARAEERERCATLIETARYTISPGVIGQEQIVALAQKIAAGLRAQ